MKFNRTLKVFRGLRGLTPSEVEWAEARIERKAGKRLEKAGLIDDNTINTQARIINEETLIEADRLATDKALRIVRADRRQMRAVHGIMRSSMRRMIQRMRAGKSGYEESTQGEHSKKTRGNTWENQVSCFLGRHGPPSAKSNEKNSISSKPT